MTSNSLKSGLIAGQTKDHEQLKLQTVKSRESNRLKSDMEMKQQILMSNRITTRQMSLQVQPSSLYLNLQTSPVNSILQNHNQKPEQKSKLPTLESGVKRNMRSLTKSPLLKKMRLQVRSSNTDCSNKLLMQKPKLSSVLEGTKAISALPTGKSAVDVKNKNTVIQV